MDIVNTFLTSQEVAYRLARFAAVLFAGGFITRALLVPASSKLYGLRKVEDHQVRNLIQVTGLLTSLVVALQAGGFGNLLTVIGTLAAALTVAIGFGMRENVANLVAGVFLHVQNPFARGDRVRIADEVGEVKKVNMRSTLLEDSSGSELIVPNSKIDSGTVKNFTRGSKTVDTLRIEVRPEKADEAKRLLQEVAEEDEKVLENSEEVTYAEFGESPVLELRFATRDQVERVRSGLLSEFTSTAVEAGIFDEEK